jgi:hypothetical protein
MRLGVDFNILNQKGTPAFYSDIFANRPTYGFAGRVFISTDTGAIYEDTGSAWTLIADAGAGTTGTLQQVTTNGNTTAQGIVVTAGNVAIGTATAGAPLDVHFSTNIGIQVNNTATGNSNIAFQNQDIGKWRIGNVYNGGANSFDVYNNTLLTTALSFNATNNAATFNNSVTATSLITSGGTSAQFVKGNGSLDSGTYLPITGSISTNDVLKVYSSGGNFYLGSSTISDNGTSVTINGRITSNSDTISVNGTAGSIQMQINNQTATTGKQWYLNSKSTGILGIGNNTASDVLTFASTGTATFLQGIQSTGTADQMLQVYGSSPSIRLYNTITSPTITGFVGMATATNNFIVGSASGDMCIGTSTAGKMYLGTGTTTVNPQLTITSTNFIGINNLSPSVALDVVGAGSLTSTGSTQLFLKSTGGGSNRNWQLQTSETAAGDLSIMQSTTAGGSTYATKFNINPNGNILIGSSSLSQTFAGYTLVDIGNGTNGGAVLFSNGAGTSYGYVNASSAGLNLRAVTGDITFNTNAFETMRIRDNNTIRYYISAGNGDTHLEWYNTSGGIIQAEIWADGNPRLNARCVSGGVYLSSGATSWASLSDINLKNITSVINNAVDKLNTLQAVHFEWKDDNDKKDNIGLIAQEIEKVFPQIVDTDKDGIKGVKYTELIPVLVKAIQEINDKLVKNNIN